ncbi:MAG: sensor histidine kinase [Chloroflexota bacterium]|nr:HAMP domain-containing protein [Chloroflexota bacterium]MBI5703729.1 HAMP domain-containing protein [Chloroflexota bacterium]
MNASLRSRLGAKIFFSYLVIIVVNVAVLFIASQFILPSAFNRHMMGMGPMMNDGMMNNMMGGYTSLPQLYADFRASFNEALMYATLAAMAAALALSLLFSRSVVAPVLAMSHATQRIAAGRYDERVQVNGNDELAQLALRFNEMAEKLNQVETMRRRLIGDVSHELRTPLTAIKGSMEGLMDGVLPAEDDTFQQIHAEAERLNRLVDDLQELSRVEARAYPLDIHPLDVIPLVQTVTKRLAPHTQSKRISLDLDLSPDLPPLLADEDRVVQILTNLVSNAIQYTPEGGSVSISAKCVNHEVQISVRDTGIGIPPEHLPHIFDRFYRVDKSRSRQAGGGSGIGLTIARALVEAQGGRIWAESKGEGTGSTFTFTLPIAAEK